MSQMLQKYFFPLSFPFMNEEEEKMLNMPFSKGSDLSVYEDDKAVHVEAALPGLNTNEIDVTFQKGVLSIRGSKKEEEADKKRKYYRKASRMYSYQIAIPGNIDESQEPTAEFKDGVMTVSFAKQKKAEPKRIQVKTNNSQKAKK
jgi:HSP20 family protein